MFFSKKRERLQTDQKKEAEIQAIRKDTFNRIDKATESMDKLADLLDNKEKIKQLGINGMIFYATGGDRRKNGVNHGK